MGSSEIQLLGGGHADYLEEAMLEGGRIPLPGDPGSGIGFDERVVDAFRRVLGESPMEVARDYDGELGNARGLDELLEAFIDRNEGFMSQSQEQRLKSLFRSCNNLAKAAMEEHELDFARKLTETIRNKVYPMLRDILQRKNQKQFAEASIDAVPADLQPTDYGDARKVGISQVQEVGKLRDSIRAAITRTLVASPENLRMQAAKQAENSAVSPGPGIQAAVVRADISLLRAQQRMWSQYSAAHGGVFDREVSRLQQGIDQQQTRLLILTQEQHGHGAAAAVSGSMGRREIMPRMRRRSSMPYMKAGVLPPTPWGKPSTPARVLHTEAGGFGPGERLRAPRVPPGPLRGRSLSSPDVLRLRGGVGSRSRSRDVPDARGTITHPDGPFGPEVEDLTGEPDTEAQPSASESEFEFMGNREEELDPAPAPATCCTTRRTP